MLRIKDILRIFRKNKHQKSDENLIETAAFDVGGTREIKNGHSRRILHDNKQ